MKLLVCVGKAVNNCKHIGVYCFNDCISVEEVKISGKTDVISRSAFRNCKKLKNIEIEHCKIIGDYAFNLCESIVTINIPEDCTKIGIGAFNSCSNLREIHMYSNIIEIGLGAFSDICNDAVIYCHGTSEEIVSKVKSMCYGVKIVEMNS